MTFEELNSQEDINVAQLLGVETREVVRGGGKGLQASRTLVDGSKRVVVFDRSDSSETLRAKMAKLMHEETKAVELAQEEPTQSGDSREDGGDGEAR